MTLPQFLLIGPEKGGTTSLREYLSQHPGIFMPRIQGANYFSLGDMDLGGRIGYTPSRYARTLESYQAHFASAPDGRVIGEASPSYFVHARAADRMHRTLPHAKLITVLRQPADRAFSHFQFNRKQTTEPLDEFEQALAAEPQRIADGWHYRVHYRRNGFYFEHLSHYFRLFPKEQIAVFLYDDLLRDARKVVRDIFRFLDVDPEFEPDMSMRLNVSGVPRNAVVERALRTAMPIRPFLERAVPPRLMSAWGRRLLRRIELDRDTRARLTEVYREDIEQLQGLIGRDLSGWLIDSRS